MSVHATFVEADDDPQLLGRFYYTDDEDEDLENLVANALDDMAKDYSDHSISLGITGKSNEIVIGVYKQSPQPDTPNS